MKNPFFAAFLLFFLFVKPVHADQLALLDADKADKAVEVLKKQKEILLFCGCCENDTMTWLLLEDAWKEPESGSYQVNVKGRVIAGYRITKAVDLAYVHINNNGMSECLGNYLSLGGDPCMDPFEWNAGARKYKPEDLVATKRFYDSFDSLRAEIIAHPPLKLLNRADLTTWLNVTSADVKLNYKTADIEFIYTLEDGYTIRQYVPLAAGAEATSTGKGNCSIRAGRYSMLKTEQFQGEYTIIYSSSNYTGMPLALGPDASPRIATWLNTLFLYYTRVGERK